QLRGREAALEVDVGAGGEPTPTELDLASEYEDLRRSLAFGEIAAPTVGKCHQRRVGARLVVNRQPALASAAERFRRVQLGNVLRPDELDVRPRHVPILGTA